MPVPTDAIAVFTRWLRTRETPDPYALLSAAFAIGQWVVGELKGQGDDGLKAAKGAGKAPAMSHEELADALEKAAHASTAMPKRGTAKGAKAAVAGLPLKLILSLIVELIEAIR